MLPALVATSLTTPLDRTFVARIGSRDVTDVVKWNSLTSQDGTSNVRGRTTLRLEAALGDYPEVRDHAPLVIYDHRRDTNMIRAYVRSVHAHHEPMHAYIEVGAEDATALLDDTLIVYETRRTTESFKARLGRFIGAYFHSAGHLSRSLEMVENLSDSLPVQAYVAMSLPEMIETLISQSDHPNATYYVDGAGRLRVYDLSGDPAPFNISNAPVTDPTDSGARIVVTDGGQHEAFPGLAYMPNGWFVLVYRSAVDHAAGGPLRVRLSSDLGATWRPEVTLDAIVGGQNVVVTSSDTVLLTYKQDDQQVYVRRSSNNALSWSDPILASAGFTDTTSVTAAAVQATNGDLLLPMYGTDTGDTFQTAAFVRSTDDGLTWGAQEVIADGELDGRNYQEPCIVRVGTTLVCLIRSDDNIFRRTISTDNGATWSALTEVVQLATGRPGMTVETSGKIFLNYRHVPTFIGDPNRTVWRRSSDAGVTWTDEAFLDPDDDDMFGVYGWAAQVPAGPLVIAYGLQGAGGVAATEADIYVRRFQASIEPHELSVDTEAQTYYNRVRVQGSTPAASLFVSDGGAIAAAGGVVRTTTIQASDVDTAAMAETLGRMYLGRVSTPKARGRFTVSSPSDGWRSGQFVRVVDSAIAVDDTFRISRVSTKPLRPGNDPMFRYTVEFGGAQAGE